MNLAELPEGTYRLEQKLDEDGEPYSIMRPIRKRWWWFGYAPTDKKVWNLAQEMQELDAGEGK